LAGNVWEADVKISARIGTSLLILAFSCVVAAENVEKAQKKELEAQAKAIIAEAKSLERTGELVGARAKYAESQAMIETNDAADAIKHLDDEIHNRVKDVLSNSRKFYESRKYTEAVAALEEGAKFGASEATVSYNLALSYFQLGERSKAAENLNKSVQSTPDPKRKVKLKQLLTFFTTGENRDRASDKERIEQLNRMLESAGLDASLQDDQPDEEEEPFSGADTPATPVSLKTSGSSTPNSHSVAGHRASLCTALDGLKENLASSAAATFDRANCAESNGRPTEALHLLQKYLELAPDALDAGNVRTRIAELQSELTLPGTSGTEVRRLYSSAYGYLAEGKYDRALAALQKSKELAPDFPLTYWKLALLQEAMANVDHARENFTRYQDLAADQSAKEEAALHLSTLEAKKSKYDEEVGDAEDIVSDLFNRGMNLTFNAGENRSAIRAKRARIKKKQDRKKYTYRVGGFAIPYPYAQQQLARASEHLEIALALFPLGPEANELMGLVLLQANDGHAATKSFDAVASQQLPVSFYAEMRGGHKFDHAVKCELTYDRVRFVFLSSYDKKGTPIPPDKNAGEDGLGDLTLAPGDERHPFDSLELNIKDIKKIETNKGAMAIKLNKEQFLLAPIYLPTFTPVEGPQARRFANNYTHLFIRYPGLEDSKLGNEGMTGGEKFTMGYNLASAGFNIATSLNPIGAIEATQSAISIARIIHSAVTSLNVSFASWEKSVNDQQQLFASQSFKPIPTEVANLAFIQELK
jgi:tetratricopeptide (TPR) repeat protein